MEYLMSETYVFIDSSVNYVKRMCVTIHDKTSHSYCSQNHFGVKAINTNYDYCSCKFEVTSQYAFGDTSQNVPGQPVQNFYGRRNEKNIATYIACGSPYTQYFWKNCAPAHNVCSH